MSKKPPKRIAARPRIPKSVRLKKVPGSQFIKAHYNLTWAQSVVITNQIVKAVKDQLGNMGKTPNGPALAEWKGKLRVAVYNRLMNGGDWAAEGPGVMVVATDMGSIAGLLSGTKSEASVDHLKGAFLACKSHDTCASAGGGVGGGAWCSFDWI